MNRWHRSRDIWIVGCLAAALAAPWAAAQGADPLEGVVSRMTREAVDAGIAGQDELRQATLAQVLELAPDYAPARWEAGQMKVGDQWVSVRQAQSMAQADPRFSEYATRHASAGDDAASQLALAEWCDEQGLSDEATYHWRRVLGVDPQNSAALDRLELAWFNGQLEPREKLESLRSRQRDQVKSLKDWNAKIDSWVRKSAGGELRQQEIIDQMRDTLDESAIPAFEQLAGSPRGWNNSQGQRKTVISKAFLELMADRQTFEGSQTLVRHALLATHGEIRQAALQHLPSRPQNETVPLLLSSLSAPLESRFDIRVTPSGRAVYSHQIFAAGPQRDQLTEISREGVVGQELPSPDSPDAGDVVEGRIRTQQTRTAYVNSFAQRAQAIEQQVARENASRKEVNARAIEALKLVTGKDLGDSPSDWWKDWYATNGYDVDSQRPLDIARDADSQYVYLAPPSENLEWIDIPDPTGDTPQWRPPTGQPRPEGGYRNPRTGMLRATPVLRCECFVAGTPVWTKTGQQAIETLREGNQVLCQDVTTGEFVFRPILARTARTPSPMVRIAAGGEEITATEGHPFWLPGRGWRMARELHPGDRLFSLDGPVTVEQVSKSPNAEAYNLVVAEHANYFVGKAGTLVHDNTPRRAEEASQLAR